MKIKRFFYLVFVFVVLLAGTFVLEACQGAGQTEKAISTTGAEMVSPTATPAPTVGETSMQSAYDLNTEFVSTTEFFRLMIPADWSVEENIPGADLVMANSEDALNKYRNSQSVESGDFVLKVGFLPLALLQDKQLKHYGFQFESSPEIFLQSLLPMFRIGDEPAGNVFGEAELISLPNGRNAGMLTFTDAAFDGVILVFEAGDDVIAFVSTLAFSGELDSFQEVSYEIAAEVEFSGDQDALFDILYGG